MLLYTTLPCFHLITLNLLDNSGKKLLVWLNAFWLLNHFGMKPYWVVLCTRMFHVDSYMSLTIIWSEVILWWPSYHTRCSHVLLELLLKNVIRVLSWNPGSLLYTACHCTVIWKLQITWYFEARNYFKISESGTFSP